jgi:hypothetical protein
MSQPIAQVGVALYHADVSPDRRRRTTEFSAKRCNNRRLKPDPVAQEVGDLFSPSFDVKVGHSLSRRDRGKRFEMCAGIR